MTNKLKIGEINNIENQNDYVIMSDYVPTLENKTNYQTEAELEYEFINLLMQLNYEYAPVKNDKELISNLRVQLERLNNYKFSDSEWNEIYFNKIASDNFNIVRKTEIIQKEHIFELKKDDGTIRNIKLIDKENIHNNKLQVINQFSSKSGFERVRYDVTILVNGLPLVHIELKRRGISIEEAFNQIKRYSESFSTNSGLFEYIQIFVISNGTTTKYYSNSIRRKIEDSNKSSVVNANNFKFTHFWTDVKNKTILDLMDFTNTFFAKNTILNLITKYCVLTEDKQLLVMRPYQIAAAERIISKVKISSSYKKWGKVEAGGYIWHTTGSGKTLTSFKTAQLLLQNNDIDKVLFVVDRKDLDYQTIREYNNFQKDCANGNINTKVLSEQLLSKLDKHRLIITTIQKLNNFLKRNEDKSVYNKHIVMIFDECHRSQFGEMHKNIIKNFKKYHLFGFTGTPIFVKNAGDNHRDGILLTTEEVFGDRLHCYTMHNAIADRNVLPFHYEMFSTVRLKDEIEDQMVEAIDKNSIILSDERVEKITRYIIENFDRKTKRKEANYVHKFNIDIANSLKNIDNAKYENKNLSGFNSLFAVDSIKAAKRYYLEFKKQLKALNKDYVIATIFTNTPVNENGEVLDDEVKLDDVESLNIEDKNFLQMAMNDYNKTFKTNYQINNQQFDNYYKDISLRMKQREIDILIVVNMFLTGFDSKLLNTLWLDKKLRYHGLLQAFSRTNRIYNSVKSYGNIVSFVDIQKEIDDAILLYATDHESEKTVFIGTKNDFLYGTTEDNGTHEDGYIDLANKIKENFDPKNQIDDEATQKEFVNTFTKFLRLRNILMGFEGFKEMEADIMSEYDFQNYCGMYGQYHDKFRPKHKENVEDDCIFDMELIKQYDIDVDYILRVIDAYREKMEGIDFKYILDAIENSYELKNKKELLEKLIQDINAGHFNSGASSRELYHEIVQKNLREDLHKMIVKFGLVTEYLIPYLTKCFRTNKLIFDGKTYDDIKKKMSLFSTTDQERRTYDEELKIYLETFFSRYSGDINYTSFEHILNNKK
ncbi:type I restriction system endonuclease [Metamycoplasma cloacale]|uniref:Type I restriction enzyme endonuclease subunit n=1 Tax=Metamycoplasma cloacale TaxID=92401 RepID=A0A2Z4LME7_9BACT|nr:type I restriction endonuclease subunit R [Metamycoplasma cloacale]AWX42991.1 type I restriction endonuclease subunit R [Metamycoplasma cloacale]VEU79185.1 type I restriction system endonuclease [Metamycoplasma cloacale]